MDAKPSEIKALIDLLDDPDDSVFRGVHDRIVSIGEPIVKDLEQAWRVWNMKGDKDGLRCSRIEDILCDINLAVVSDGLRVWAASREQDLLEGALLVARYKYPHLNMDVTRGMFKSILELASKEIHATRMEPMEVIAALNTVVFKRFRFAPNKENPYTPHNSYISDVFARKKGSPTSLGLIYLAIAEKLDIPLRGVGLPHHFVMAYTYNEKVLFYVNPTKEGEILGLEELHKFLDRISFERHKKFVAPCDKPSIMYRLLNNLITSYSKTQGVEAESRIRDIDSLCQILKPDAG